MFELSRNLATAAIVCLALCGLVTKLDALRCRDGIENSIGYVYSTDTCAASQTACFQSVKCYKIGDVAYKDYNWACIEGSKCSNSTGKYIASYKGVKGRSQISQLRRVALLGQTSLA